MNLGALRVQRLKQRGPTRADAHLRTIGEQRLRQSCPDIAAAQDDVRRSGLLQEDFPTRKRVR